MTHSVQEIPQTQKENKIFQKAFTDQCFVRNNKKLLKQEPKQSHNTDRRLKIKISHISKSTVITAGPKTSRNHTIQSTNGTQRTASTTWSHY